MNPVSPSALLPEALVGAAQIADVTLVPRRQRVAWPMLDCLGSAAWPGSIVVADMHPRLNVDADPLDKAFWSKHSWPSWRLDLVELSWALSFFSKIIFNPNTVLGSGSPASSTKNDLFESERAVGIVVSAGVIAGGRQDGEPPDESLPLCEQLSWKMPLASVLWQRPNKAPELLWTTSFARLRVLSPAGEDVR